MSAAEDIRYMSDEQRIAEGYKPRGRSKAAPKPVVPADPNQHWVLMGNARPEWVKTSPEGAAAMAKAGKQTCKGTPPA